ncbi:MAG: 16S rRNA processing protein RimM [Flavobacteriales bacterium]|jgi:16S rRNA processing protein RimM|nr:16S rRNA processing protein RimM [Flavobacteriales bacterium]MBT7481177.1 16S rRNA processing protein RimM [Flavobacteriales bacterium]
MKKQECFLFGTIFKLHGYKGDVNIYNDNDIPLVFSEIDFFYVEENNELIPYFADSVRPKKKKILLVKFEDVDSEEVALRILKRQVYLPNKFLPKIEDIIPDKIMVGFDVMDKTLGKVGIVDFVNDKTAQKLIIVKEGEKEFFIPFHDNFVLNIDLEKKILNVDVPEELMNIN